MYGQNAQASLEAYVASVRASARSDFYAKHWDAATEFSDLPVLSRADLMAVPLSRRRYKDERGMVKIVHAGDAAFLSEWSFEDIGREPWGEVSERPMVLLQDPHAAIEKSMWCYERNRVPLVADKNIEVALFAAEKYRIDSLITDSVSLPSLLPHLQRMPRQLSCISILGESFQPSELLPFAAYAEKVRLVLELPETGVIAEAPLSERPAFVLASNCIAETDEGCLVLTKTALLVTPVIKYRTGIKTKMLEGWAR